MGIGGQSGMVITWVIIIFTSIVSFTAFNRNDIFNRWKFNPYIIIQDKQWYRFFTYSLLHADWMHLLMNMFVLYSFGEQVEFFMKYYFGVKGLLFYGLLYIGGFFLSVIPSFEKHKHDSWYNAVGASGAVSAVVFSSIIFMPTSKMILIFLPFPIPAPIFGILYLIFSAYMARRASDNIGHDAHFWGALFGALFTIALKPVLAISFYYQLIHSIF
jgi:membrane associated rhomboid family serine protease